MKKNKVDNINAELIKTVRKLGDYLAKDKVMIYIFGFLCYRYLSEKVQIAVKEILGEETISYEEAWRDIEFNQKIKKNLLDNLGFIIEPKNLFSEIIQSISENKFEIINLESAFNNFNTYFTVNSESTFKDLFQNLEFDLDISRKNEENYTEVVKYSLKQISLLKLEIDGEHENPYLKASQYLIDYFKTNATKDDGGLFTPKEICKLLINLVENNNDCDEIYDPVCGIGTLLTINTANKKLYGQEKNDVYNLAKMNLLLQGIKYKELDIKNGDIIENPRHIEIKFKAIISNLVHCTNWSGDTKYIEEDRFKEFKALPPKSKAEYAFIEHMLYQLEEKGKMAIVVSRGVLFRGANEGIIRKQLIKEKNYLDGVIGLPSNLIPGTSIPVVLMIFKKGRNKNDDVMFIDASNEFEKIKKKNMLREDHIQKIIATYNQRKSIDKYSRSILLDEIEKNDFNLNITRYIETFEEEEEVDVKALKEEINQLNKEILILDNEIEECLKLIM